MKELSLHIMDIMENGISAGATLIELHIIESKKANLLTIRIRDNGRGIPRDEIKKVSVPDTGVYNLELREAIEANLMLDVAELTFGSALFRKESRGHHNRMDYPDTNDKDWRCHTIATLDGDKTKYTKRDVIYTSLKPEDVG